MKLQTTLRMHKLSIIIVNYNVKFYLEQCLKSVLKSVEHIDAEIFVVDNHSADGSVDYISTRFPQVTLIASNHNNGFAYANNTALRQSNGEYILLLNPDTIVSETTLDDCIAFMESHADAGVVGVRMLKDTGENARESRRGIPTLLTALYKITGLCDMYPTHPKFGKYYMGYLPWENPAEIDIVSGAFFFTRRSVLDKVGLLDEDFFMYGEDIDLSYRILQNGFRNWYLPTPILHYKGESTEKSSFRYVHVFYKAMLIFYKKHFSGTRIFIDLPVSLAIYGKALITLLANQMKLVSRSLGFTHRRHHLRDLFVFMGTKQQYKAFLRLANRHGLQAEYGGESTAQPSVVTNEQNKSATIHIVYNTDAMPFSQIFSCMEQHAEKRFHLGTFSPKNNTLITSKEVYR